MPAFVVCLDHIAHLAGHQRLAGDQHVELALQHHPGFHHILVEMAPAGGRRQRGQIAAADDVGGGVVEYLAQAPERLPAQSMEVEIGGPDVLSYGEMLDRMADALGLRPRRRLAVPLLTPKLSSLWIGLVTPVDAGVARPLIEGLSTPTTVRDASGMKHFEITPIGFMEALLKAVAEDPDLEGGHGTAVRLEPQETYRVSSHGPIESVDTAELITGGDRPTTPGRDLLESAARGYWPFIARRLLGIVRVTEGPDGSMALRLRVPGLALLRFGRMTVRVAPGGRIDHLAAHGRPAGVTPPPGRSVPAVDDRAFHCGGGGGSSEPLRHDEGARLLPLAAGRGPVRMVRRAATMARPSGEFTTP